MEFVVGISINDSFTYGNRRWKGDGREESTGIRRTLREYVIRTYSTPEIIALNDINPAGVEYAPLSFSMKDAVDKRIRLTAGFDLPEGVLGLYERKTVLVPVKSVNLDGEDLFLDGEEISIEK